MKYSEDVKDPFLRNMHAFLCSSMIDLLNMQLKKPFHPTRGVPTAINCLATLLKEPVVRSSFVQADGVKLLVPLISPASTQQSIQVSLSDSTSENLKI